MKRGAHESNVEYRHVDPPSDRKFGLTVGLVLIGIAAVRWGLGHRTGVTTGFLMTGTLLVLAGMLVPRVLAPLNRAWMKLGLLMATVVNPVVMLAMFAIAFVPLGMAMRIGGRDVLQVRKKPSDTSYWHDPDDSDTRPTAVRLADQF